MEHAAVVVDHLTHRYGVRMALGGISFAVAQGEIFGLLGPNGSGKSTLFRVLSTLLKPSAGHARMFGRDVLRHPDWIRRQLGVVFQRPSVDCKLTVRENLHHHGRLYGLGRAALADRTSMMAERLGISERLDDRVDTLSGGLQRRVELAKGLLHSPQILLLDEPSTGLDPAARRDFTRYLTALRDREGVAVILTTHHMDEAERCDRVGILHQGNLVSIGSPDALKANVGGDVVVIHPSDPARLETQIRARFGGEVAVVDGTLRTERPRGHEFIKNLVEAFPADVKSVTFGKPTLEDVFVHFTGHRFRDTPPNGSEG